MTVSTLTYLDGYCERAGNPDLWAEPLNAVTNLAFIIAAYLVWRALRKLPDHTFARVGDIYLLIASLTAIGIGSFIWHSFAGHTVLADVIPIALFINIYLIAALKRLFGFGWTRTVSLWGIYQLAGMAAQIYLPPNTLHGTVMYLPTLGALGIMTGALVRKQAPEGAVFAKVLSVWVLSLMFRTIDLDVCSAIPIGTHFLWHLLNAWVLWRLSMVLVARAQSLPTS